MTVVWLIIALLAVCFVVVVFGSALLRFFAAAVAIVATPAREVVRLYKSNQKKKAYTLAASVAFVLVVLPLLLWLLSVIIP